MSKLPTPNTCKCGSTGSWAAGRAVIGTHAGKPVVHAGCPTCRGTAVGPMVAERVWLRS